MGVSFYLLSAKTKMKPVEVDRLRTDERLEQVSVIYTFAGEGNGDDDDMTRADEQTNSAVVVLLDFQSGIYLTIAPQFILLACKTCFSSATSRLNRRWLVACCTATCLFNFP